ncbi:MAG: chromate transporter [Lachnospiraceae bacterium]|nr:chromate transporter [Lachnospiraceae bacterium]
MRKIIKLFLSMLYISAFTFGGGFVIVTFMKKKFVDELKWLGEQEMLDITALAQSAPGAIAVNAAILTGWKVSGVKGVMAAVTGTIIPPMVILSVVSFFYEAFASNVYVAMILKGMQAGVAAVIIDVVINMGGNILKENKVLNACIAVAAFMAAFIFKVNAGIIILVAVAVGIINFLMKRGEVE